MATSQSGKKRGDYAPSYSDASKDLRYAGLPATSGLTARACIG
ncbi:hypothetical protein [Herbaspirillum huttiense]